MSALPDDVHALLQALHAALDIPLPGLGDDAERAHHRLLVDRTTAAWIVLDGVLNDGHDLPEAAGYLARRTAETPVTYTPWASERDGGDR
jgi:hypothetical protein